MNFGDFQEAVYLVFGAPVLAGLSLLLGISLLIAGTLPVAYIARLLNRDFLNRR